MKDTQKILRTAVYNALNGAITYDATAVPIFDERQPATSTNDVYILLSNQSEAWDEASETFITTSTITIEIVAKTGSEVSKDVIDDISDDIYQILRPTTTTSGLTLAAGFQLGDIRRESANTQSFAITDTQSVTVKSITITTTIIQTT